METRPLAGAHAGRDKKLIFGQMTTGNNAKKTEMSRQRLSHSSPLGRPIHFGEGLAETGQARQRLGASCDLLSAYQYVLYEVQLTTMTSKALHSRSRYPLAFPFFEVLVWDAPHPNGVTHPGPVKLQPRQRET